MRLGDVVNVTGHPKGSDAALVVVAFCDGGIVKLAYFGSKRWYKARTFHADIVSAGVGPKAIAARRALAAERFDADGWKRIQAGRYGQKQYVYKIRHISMEES